MHMRVDTYEDNGSLSSHLQIEALVPNQVAGTFELCLMTPNFPHLFFLVTFSR